MSAVKEDSLSRRGRVGEEACRAAATLPFHHYTHLSAAPSVGHLVCTCKEILMFLSRPHRCRSCMSVGMIVDLTIEHCNYSLLCYFKARFREGKGCLLCARIMYVQHPRQWLHLPAQKYSYIFARSKILLISL